MLPGCRTMGACQRLRDCAKRGKVHGGHPISYEIFRHSHLSSRFDAVMNNEIGDHVEIIIFWLYRFYPGWVFCYILLNIVIFTPAGLGY